jgi:hypothetical protein
MEVHGGIAECSSSQEGTMPAFRASLNNNACVLVRTRERQPSVKTLIHLTYVQNGGFDMCASSDETSTTAVIAELKSY